MKYYVVSDVHGFYSALKEALQEKGFFEDTVPHKLILCGDMMDRGTEALEMQRFMMELHNKNELIFIRGNHEDLMLEMLNNYTDYIKDIACGVSHHNHNGTFETAMQLSQMPIEDALKNSQEFVFKALQSDFCSKLIPASLDYYETDNYIFVHGWIPCITDKMPAWYQRNRHYEYNPDWRNAHANDWEAARWFNGMKLAEIYNVVECGKRIVCGHWHTSYGHCYLEGKCSEFSSDADFTPYYSKNIIAIDACTAHSGMVNCLVIED